MRKADRPAARQMHWDRQKQRAEWKAGSEENNC